MIQSIIVPLDGSPFGEQALPLAHAVAAASGAVLHLAHVHTPADVVAAEAMVYVPAELDTAIQSQRRKYLEDLTKRQAPGLATAPTATMLEGSIAPALEQHAASVKADLIVMTAPGRGPLSRAWFGSTTMAIVRHLEVPILLIRPEEKQDDLTAARSIHNVLIALDGSPLAEQILRPAAELAHLMGAECTLVRVMPPLVRGQMDPVDVTLSHLDEELLRKLTELHDAERTTARTYLESKAAQLRADGLAVQSRLLVHDQPAPALLDEANRIHADLIAVATHGRNAIARMFLGGVADKVVRGAHCPVLIFRPR